MDSLGSMEKRFYMKEDSSFQEFPTYVKQSSSKPRLFIIFISLFVLVVAVLAVLYFLGAKTKDSKPTVSAVPKQISKPTDTVVSSTSAELSISTTPLPSSKLTPTGGKANEKSVLERSSLHVAILNGSGTPGAAKQISSYLNSVGYTIQTIGNADDFTYRNITVKIKKAKSEYLAQLKKDIAENSPSITILTSVDDKLSADAEVIVGK